MALLCGAENVGYLPSVTNLANIVQDSDQADVTEQEYTGVGSSIDNTRVVSESDPPPPLKPQDACCPFLKNILKHFKHCPDQIHDQMDDNAEEPRSNYSLEQYSEFCQILRILQH